jgi:hydroxyethylthiazole kinase-like uncharacterized protein yjeF
MKVSRVSEMRDMDRTAIEEYGIAPDLLMENAGHAAYFALNQEFAIRRKSFTILCGLGNNGGDGFVLARKLHANGGVVQVFLLGEPERYKGAAKNNYEILTRLPIEVSVLEDLGSLKEALSQCDLVVDAIFGTGLSREVEGIYREVIELINARHKPVLSIDIPSGVHGDTGLVMGVAVQADVTVTFGLPKVGNMLSPGHELGGKLYVSHISFPPELHDSDSLHLEINSCIPFPNDDGAELEHKANQLLTIGGSQKNSMTPSLSARTFLKSGGGCSYIAAPQSILPLIANKESEIVLVPQEETSSGCLSAVSKGPLLQLIEEMDIVIMGSGLSRQEETQRLAREVALEIIKPLILFGEGVAAFYKELEVLRKRKGPTILALDLEQLSQISSKPMPEIHKHKLDILLETAASLNVVLVLMEKHALIGFPEGRGFINMSGNLRMATPGSEDVLMGAIAALYCHGLSLEDAARQGMFIYGLAEDLVAQTRGEDRATPEEFLEHLPVVIKICRDGLSNTMADRAAGVQCI